MKMYTKTSKSKRGDTYRDLIIIPTEKIKQLFSFRYNVYRYNV